MTLVYVMPILMQQNSQSHRVDYFVQTGYSFVPGLEDIPVQNTGPEVTVPSISGHRT
jgi:hypothetical protein